ncbi:MAG: sodium/solute symporter [Leptospiraceae bacterium]|nr:sodium/solute symporter [Leptospiraceae bacterium]
MDFFFKFEPTSIHYIDVILIVVYMLSILAFGFYIGREVKDSSDFFIAGRSLAWWVVGLSIVGSNLGSIDYVGASGGAYSIGVAQANFEWIGAIPAMIVCSFFFIPFYWKTGVFSIPEYLGLRYNQFVRILSAGILCIFSILSIGIFLWSTALMLHTYLGWPLGFSIIATAIVVGIYSVTGGLKAVAITDTIQVFIMLAGSFGLAYMGIQKVGGMGNFLTELNTNYPDHLRAFLPSDHPKFPWPGVLLGLAIVLSPAYWCTNQVILQRCLGAKSLWDSQASLIFAAFTKTVAPFLIILPGFLVLILTTEKLDHQDQVLPWIIKNVLPPGLSGILFVAFIAALQSSVDSTLNSTATLVTRDIYGVLSKSPKDDKKDLKIGKWVTASALVFGVVSAPLTSRFEGIYEFIQIILSFFQGPMFSLMLFGILSKIPTPKSGLISLIAGLIFSMILGYFKINMLYIAFFSFVFSTACLIGFGFFTEKLDEEKLKTLTFGK